MFAGSEEGAKRQAAAYIALGTVLLDEINPFDFLCKPFDLSLV